LSFTGGDKFTMEAAGTRGGDAGELVLERVRWCAEKAKGGIGVRARAQIGPEGGRRGEASGLRAAALAIDGRGHHGSVLKEGNDSN
jgi:hypothetical protein